MKSSTSPNLIFIRFFAAIVASVALAGCNHPSSEIDSGFLGGVALSTGNSTLQLSAKTVPVGGSVSVVLTVKDFSGNNYYVAGSNPTVVFSLTGGTSLGNFGAVTNNHDGTYSVNFSGLTIGTAGYVSATIDGEALSALASIQVTDGASQNFNFNIPFTAGTDSSYTLSSSSIELVGGVCRLVASDDTDSDNSSAHFGATGVGLTGVSWDSNLSALRLTTTTNMATLDASWAPHWGNVVGHWSLNEPAGSSTVADSSIAAANPGVINGTVTLGTAGQLGTAAGFSGAGWILLKSGSLVGTQPTGSISLWVSSSNPNLSGEQAIYDESDVGTVFRIRRFGNTIDFGSINNTASFVEIASPDLTWGTGIWHHAVATWTTSSKQLYVDGVLAASDSQSGATIHTPVASWFGRYGQGYFFDGTIDEAAVWSGVALSADEVQNIYQRQLPKLSGQITSRVLPSYSAQAWTAVSSTTRLPFYKEIPTSNEPASRYSASIGATGSASDSALATGLIGLWHLNEPASTSGTGSIVDASAKGNNGTPSGTVAFGSVGRFGNSATFDGLSGTINLGAASNALDGLTYPISMSAWIYPTSVVGQQAIFGKWDGPNARLILETNGSEILVGFYGSSTLAIISSGANISIGKWSQVTAVRNSATQVSIYINGQPVSAGVFAGYSSSGSDPGPSADTLAIGSSGSGGKFFAGSIDELAVWSRALDPGEALNLYRRGGNRLKYQVRTCTQSDCSDQDALTSTGQGWKGPGDSQLSYFSELYNTTNNVLGGMVSSSSPTMTFANFGGLSLTSSLYFQYRAIFESDDLNSLCTYNGGSAACSPELQAVSAASNGSFDATIPTITSKASIGSAYKTIDANGFTETLGGNGCAGGVRYSLSADGISFYYWSGTAWALSTSYATANDGITLKANVATFPSSVAGVGTLQVRTFLKSSGSAACEVDNLLFTGRN